MEDAMDDHFFNVLKIKVKLAKERLF